MEPYSLRWVSSFLVVGPQGFWPLVSMCQGLYTHVIIPFLAGWLAQHPRLPSVDGGVAGHLMAAFSLKLGGSGILPGPIWHGCAYLASCPGDNSWKVSDGIFRKKMCWVRILQNKFFVCFQNTSWVLELLIRCDWQCEVFFLGVRGWPRIKNVTGSRVIYDSAYCGPGCENIPSRGDTQNPCVLLNDWSSRG